MIAPDSSVVIAALLVRHDAHARARAELGGERLGLVAHVAFEVTSVLSRMPEGQRIATAVVLGALERMFPSPWLTLDAAQAERTLRTSVAAGIAGGALYDALIAATAAEHGAVLLSNDRRAARTYDALGTTVRFVDPVA